MNVDEAVPVGGAVLVCSALALEIEVEAALEVEVRGGLDEVVDDSIVACSWGRWRCPKLTGLYLADHGVEREAVETGLNLADHGVERDAVEEVVVALQVEVGLQLKIPGLRWSLTP